MLLEDSGPVGGMFTHAGKTYQVKPNYFCTALLRKIKARIKQLDREQAKQILMEPNSHPELRQAAIQRTLRSTIGALDVVTSMDDLDILPVLISHGCEMSLSDAERIVQEYPDPFELQDILVNSAGLESIKNSLLLRSQKLNPADDLDVALKES